MTSYNNYQATAIPIKDVIDCMSGNSGLTEQFIYQTIQQKGKRYIVLSSSTEERTKLGEIPKCDINGKPLKVFENKEGLLVIRNGKAGKTIYLPKGDYTINDHAYILSVKDDSPYKIHLKWLSIQYKEEFLSYSSSADNGTWNMTGFFNNVLIDIPEYDEQLKLVREYEGLEGCENIVKDGIKQTSQLFEMQLAQLYKKYQATAISIKDVIDCMSGNSGLTSEFIYKKSQMKGKKYTVLTSSPDSSTSLGLISKCHLNGRNIKVFEDKEGLLVVRVGNAGATYYLPKGAYTITENAYILSVKDDCSYKISIKWLMIQYQQSFKEYGKMADYGAWNMTGFFNNVLIDIPEYDEQIEVVKEYESLWQSEDRLKGLNGDIQGILSKTIA